MLQVHAIKIEAQSWLHSDEPLANQALEMLKMVDETIAQVRACKKCGQPKPVSAYGKMAGRTDGRPANICKACVSARQAEWRQQNITLRDMSSGDVGEFVCKKCKELKNGDSFRKNINGRGGRDGICSGCRRLQDRARYARETEARTEQAKWGGVKWRFGLTKADCEARWSAQDGKCEICSDPIQLARGTVGSVASACIDHDHETQKVRGLLCRRCNFGIGSLRDSSAIADKAAAYLRKHGK